MPKRRKKELRRTRERKSIGYGKNLVVRYKPIWSEYNNVKTVEVFPGTADILRCQLLSLKAGIFYGNHVVLLDNKGETDEYDWFFMALSG